MHATTLYPHDSYMLALNQVVFLPKSTCCSGVSYFAVGNVPVDFGEECRNLCLIPCLSVAFFLLFFGYLAEAFKTICDGQNSAVEIGHRY